MSTPSLSSFLQQMNIPNKNGRLYGYSPFLRYLDYLHPWSVNVLPKKPVNTLLRPYQKSLVPDLPQSQDNKETEKRLTHYLSCGCKVYEHQGLNEFLYTQSCLGNDLLPEPEKTPLRKKKPRKKEEDKKIPLPEQMHTAYLESKKPYYDALWQHYMEYVEAMRLADHIVQQQDTLYIIPRPVTVPTFTISTTVRKMKVPKIVHGMGTVI